MWRSVVEPVATTYLVLWHDSRGTVAREGWEDTATYPPLSIRATS